MHHYNGPLGPNPLQMHHMRMQQMQQARLQQMQQMQMIQYQQQYQQQLQQMQQQAMLQRYMGSQAYRNDVGRAARHARVQQGWIDDEEADAAGYGSHRHRDD